MRIFILSRNPLDDPSLILAAQEIIDNGHELVSDYLLSDTIIVAPDMEKTNFLVIGFPLSQIFSNWKNLLYRLFWK